MWVFVGKLDLIDYFGCQNYKFLVFFKKIGKKINTKLVFGKIYTSILIILNQ